MMSDQLLRSYGPFLVHHHAGSSSAAGSSACAGSSSGSAAAGSSGSSGSGAIRAIRAPLVCFDTLVSAVRHSFPMEMLLKTHTRAYDYVSHCSGVELARASASDARAARAVADRHGLPFPLFLHKAARGGHAWASDVDRIKAFLACAGGGARAVGTDDAAVPCDSLESFVAAGTADVDDDATAYCSSPNKCAPATGRRPLSLAARMAVWNTWQVGGAEAGSGPCHVCSRAILQQDFECGHVVSVARGGSNSIDNLRPLCRTCNRSMGTMCLDEFKEDLMGVKDVEAAATAAATAAAADGPAGTGDLGADGLRAELLSIRALLTV